MEQYKNCSPGSPHAYACAPASPLRHIHSSFPHYFYSTPAAPPSSHSISAFVALCESRLLAEDVDVPATPASSTVAPKATVPPPQAPRPLKPPPRLQYIANIRKSLRNGISGLRRSSRGGGGGGGSRAPAKLSSNVERKDGADPFVVAAHKVTREEEGAPRCQLPWRRNRKSKLAREAKLADDQDAKATAVSKSDDGMMNQAEVATSKNRKGSWIFRMLRSAIKAKGKEKEKESSIDSKEDQEEEEEEEDHAGKNGQLVGLVRSTTASRRRRVLVRRRSTRGSSRRRQY